MFLKRDPGPCIIDHAPHTTCCAPGDTTTILAGRISTPTTITVPAPPAFGQQLGREKKPVLNTDLISTPATTGSATTDATPPTFTSSSYRGKRSRPSTAGS